MAKRTSKSAPQSRLVKAKKRDPDLEGFNLLGADERRVVGRLITRLLHGQTHYGLLNIASDPRDWRQEGAEELEDFLVYLAVREIAKADGLKT